MLAVARPARNYPTGIIGESRGRERPAADLARTWSRPAGL